MSWFRRKRKEERKLPLMGGPLDGEMWPDSDERVSVFTQEDGPAYAPAVQPPSPELLSGVQEGRYENPGFYVRMQAHFDWVPYRSQVARIGLKRFRDSL